MIVRCKCCDEEYDEKELIYDGEMDMEFCPYCGEGNSVVNVSEQEVHVKTVK